MEPLQSSEFSVGGGLDLVVRYCDPHSLWAPWSARIPEIVSEPSPWVV